MVSVTSTSATAVRSAPDATASWWTRDPRWVGTSRVPNPYQLVLAGLVQCTAATLRMYANRKGWALGEVKVRARLLRTGDGATKVERIERTITVGRPVRGAEAPAGRDRRSDPGDPDAPRFAHHRDHPHVTGCAPGRGGRGDHDGLSHPAHRTPDPPPPGGVGPRRLHRVDGRPRGAGRASICPARFTTPEAWLAMAQWRGQWELRGSGHFAVEERSTGRFVGRAGLHRPEQDDWPGPGGGLGPPSRVVGAGLRHRGRARPHWPTPSRSWGGPRSSA